MRTRLRIFGLIFAVGIVGLIVRLFFWQVLKASDLSLQGKLQYQRTSTVTAGRGSIFATDGSYLTTNENDWTLFATKSTIIETPRSIANKLSALLGMDASKIEGILNQNGVWLPIAHRVKNDVKKNIEALSISGIAFDLEPDRTYPEGSSSSHILGFVGKDDGGNDTGYFGLEGYYDQTLTGKTGLINRESDANGNPILFGNSNQVTGSAGVDLVTNIDKTVQFAIEKELNDGLARYGSKAGTVIMMDPATGAILGMASVPSYDPGSYWKYTNEDFKDAAISN